MSYNNNNQSGYGQQARYQQPGQYSNNTGYGQNVEMQHYDAPAQAVGRMPSYSNQYPPPQPASQPAPTDLLDLCQSIDRSITDLETRLQSLQQLHRRVLNDQASPSQLDRENSEIMAGYRGLTDRVRKMKGNRESGSPRYAAQVGRVDRRLKKSLNDYQRVESDFRKQMQEQQARQYRIVRPDASEAEVREAIEEPNTQIFQQALLNSNRTGQSQSALSAVRARHAEIQRIEQTIVELAQLFQDLDVIVQEQDVLVQNIETKGEDIQQNIYQANEQLDTGIKSARAARKKKWICFWIVVIVLIIIVVAVVAYVVTHLPANNKAAAPAATTSAVRRAVEFLVESREGTVVRRSAEGFAT